MKFLKVQDLRIKSDQIWQELSVEREMIITKNGKPIAILSSINEHDFEQVLSASRQARASSAVAALQFDSVKKGTDKISMEEIDSEISVR
jgi:antitoxin (DNA-binding transcriptional repressor) of toxin-antitoxin stability system